MKLRSDMLFLLLAGRPKSFLVLTEQDIYQLFYEAARQVRIP